MPERINCPWWPTRRVSTGAISISGAARMLATTSGQRPATVSGVPWISSSRSSSPLRRAFSAAMRSASPSTSTAVARGSQRQRAERQDARPVPTSSTAAGGPWRTASSSAVRHSAVVGCRPVPNAGASIRRSAPGSAARCAGTTRSDPMRTGRGPRIDTDPGVAPHGRCRRTLPAPSISGRRPARPNPARGPTGCRPTTTRRRARPARRGDRARRRRRRGGRIRYGT